VTVAVRHTVPITVTSHCREPKVGSEKERHRKNSKIPTNLAQIVITSEKLSRRTDTGTVHRYFLGTTSWQNCTRSRRSTYVRYWTIRTKYKYGSIGRASFSDSNGHLLSIPVYRWHNDWSQTRINSIPEQGSRTGQQQHLLVPSKVIDCQGTEKCESKIELSNGRPKQSTNPADKGDSGVTISR
jgi:hypothetical protein